MTSPEVKPVAEPNALNVVDLFSGVGGLSLGSARAGLPVLGAIDNDQEALSAHKLNFPRAIHLNADVAQLSGQTLKHEMQLGENTITGIIGSPPCQGFSAMGQHNRDDTRNRLFVDFFRLVSEVLPKFFLVENVPGIMRQMHDEVREHAISLVERKYVVLPPMELAANDYGAATLRKRVFFFGFLPDEMEHLTVNNFRPPPEVETIHVKDALSGLPITINPLWQREEQSWRKVHVCGHGDYAQRLHGHIPPGVGDKTALERLHNSSEASGFLGTLHSAKVAKRFANTACGKYDLISKSFRLDPDGFCPTLRAGTGPELGSFQAVRPIHPTEPRVITPREAARLQGFPDWFQFSPTKWHSFRQIGNSVSPILAERILCEVATALGTTDQMEVLDE